MAGLCEGGNEPAGSLTAIYPGNDTKTLKVTTSVEKQLHFFVKTLNIEFSLSDQYRLSIEKHRKLVRQNRTILGKSIRIGNVEDRPRSGRPRSTRGHEDHYLVLMVRRNPLHNATELYRRFLDDTGGHIYTQTIRNRHHANLRSGRPWRTLKMTSAPGLGLAQCFVVQLAALSLSL
ncbi:hypothetical protein ANN_17606 [Periplaneta americana]|uniref:Uncharacterized protein n=1 Tax=Periplaneta americana TaxID=6978 RepID=A0ABQ8SUW2_PERAM|nr:hypothetical protein ANN_17606 [Periplaneta americana]